MIQFSENIVPKEVVNTIVGDDINPTKKDMDWHLKIAQHVFGNWFYHGDNDWYGYRNQAASASLRKYSNGEQDTEQYKTLLLGPKKEAHGATPDQAAKRKSFMNVNWNDVFSVAPKFVRLLKDRLNQIEYDIEVESVDEKSCDQKEQHRFLMMAKSILRPWIENLQESYNAQLTKPEDWLPDNMEQMDLYSSIGGTNLLHEILYQKILDFSFDESRWDKEAVVRCQEDLIDYNVACVQDYVDENDNLIKCRYVDVTKLIGTYDRTTGFSKSWCMGQLRLVTAAEIRKSLQNEGLDKDVINDRMSKVCRMNGGRHGNRTLPMDWQYEYDSSKSQWSGDDMNVWIVDLEFKSMDDEYLVTNKKKNIEYRGQHGKILESEKFSTRVNRVQVLRSVLYPVGCNWCYNYGLAKNIKRSTNLKEVDFSYHTVFIPGKSLTMQAKPIYDQIQLNYLKHQNALAQAKGNGIAINVNAIKAISWGNNNRMEAPDILAMYSQSNVLLWSSTTLNTINNIGQTRPFEQLPGGMGALLQEFITDFEYRLNQLREIFGITPQASASGRPTDEGLGIAKMQQGVVDSSLSVMYDQMRDLKEKAATGMYKKFNLYVKHNKKTFNGYYPILGSTNMVSLQLEEDMWERNCKFHMRARPTQEMKQQVIQGAMESLVAGRNGGVGIKYSDFNFVLRLIDRGRIKEATAYVAYREEHYEKVKAKNMAELEKQKAALVDESNKQKSAQAKEELKAKADSEIEVFSKTAEIEFDYDLKRWNEIRKPEIELENQVKLAAPTTSEKK